MSEFDLLQQPIFLPSCDIHGHLSGKTTFWKAEEVVDKHKEEGCSGWFHIFKEPSIFPDTTPPYPQDY